MQHTDKTPFQPMDVSKFKIVEVNGLKIYVENEKVGERIRDTLTRAELREWYAKAANQVILYGKESTKSGKLRIIALDLNNVSHNADSEIYFPNKGHYEIRISTLNAHSIAEKIAHETAHGVLELGNPNRGDYSAFALEHQEKLRVALCTDYANYSNKRASLVPIQKSAAKLIFGFPRQYPVKEHTAEHLCFGLQALVHSEKAAISVAPNYMMALKNYISAEGSRKIGFKPSVLQKPPALRNSLPSPAATTAVRPGVFTRNAGVIYPDEVIVPKGNQQPSVRHNPDIEVQPVKPFDFKNAAKTGYRYGTKLLSLYFIAKDTGEHYSYIREHNPHLFAQVTTGVTAIQFRARCEFWSAVYRINPYVATCLQLSSYYSTFVPDTNAGFNQAWNELKPEDFKQTVQTAEQDFLNALYYENPFGPCYGLTDEKLKDLGPGVLALNPELMEGQALESPIRALGNGVNAVNGAISQGVYLAADSALQRAGLGKANPTDVLKATIDFKTLQDHLTLVAPPKREYKGDILSQTLLPPPKKIPGTQFMPASNSTPAFPASSPPAYFPDFEYVSDLKTKIKDSFDPKAEYIPQLGIGTQPPADPKTKFYFDVFGNGGEFGLLAGIKMEELSIEALLSLGLASLFIGGIITGISYMYQKSKFEEKVDIIKSQCKFVSDEVKYVIKLYERAYDKLVAYQEAGPDADKDKLFQSAFNTLTKINQFNDKTLSKYQHILSDKHAKLDVVTIDPHSYGLRMFSRQNIQLSHPRLPKSVLKRLQRQIERQQKKAGKAPVVYHHNVNKVSKEAREYIEEKAIPSLTIVQSSLGGLLDVFVEMSIPNLTTALLECDNEFEAIRIKYESGYISREDFDTAAEMYYSKVAKLQSQFNNVLSVCPEENKSNDVLNAWLETVGEVIAAKDNMIEVAYSIRLVNDCNSLANQFHAGVLTTDQFTQSVDQLVAGMSEEEQKDWRIFVNDNIEIGVYNDHVNSFNKVYSRYTKAKKNIENAVNKFKAGKISKDKFIELVADILKDLELLQKMLADFDKKPEDVERSAGFKHELEQDSGYFNQLVNSTINTIYNEKIEKFNQRISDYRDRHKQLTDDFHNKVITEQQYLKRCAKLYKKHMRDINSLSNQVTANELCDDATRQEVAAILAGIPTPDTAQVNIILFTLNSIEKGASAEQAKSALDKAGKHWEAIQNKKGHDYLLLLMASASFNTKNYALSKAHCLEALSLNDKNFEAFLLMIRADMQLESPEAGTLKLIDTYKRAFEAVDHQTIIAFYESYLTDDIAALDGMYDRLKTIQDPELRSSLMIMCHYKRENLVNPRRNLAIYTANSDVIAMLKIDRWLELLVMHTLQIEELQKTAAESDDKTKAAIQEQIEALKKLQQQALQTAAYQLDVEKNMAANQAIKAFNYSNVISDVALYALSDRIQKSFKLSERKFQLVKQGISSSLQCAASIAGDFVSRVALEDIIKRAGLTPEQAKGLDSVFNQNSNAGFVKSASEYLSVFNSLSLVLKLAIIISDYQLQCAYEEETKALRMKPSFQGWLSENKDRQQRAVNLNMVRVGTDVFSSTQLLLSLYLFIQDNNDMLTIARKAVTIFLNLPMVHQFITTLFVSKTGETPANRTYAFYNLLVQNLYGGPLQQMFFLHEETIFRMILNLMEHTPLLNYAVSALPLQKTIHNVFFVLRSLKAVFLSALSMDAHVITLKVNNLQCQFMEIMKKLNNAATESEKLLAYKEASFMFGDVKHAAMTFTKDNIDAPRLYSFALYYQHRLDNSIEIVEMNGDGSGLFKAVSAYTKQSAAELRMACAKAVVDNSSLLKDFLDISVADYYDLIKDPKTPGDAICIYLLTKLLRRSIIVIFDDMSLDLAKQGLNDRGSIIDGDPIFVLLDEKLERYHVLEMRGERYYEDRLSEKSANGKNHLSDSAMKMLSSFTKCKANSDLKQKVKLGQAELSKLPDPVQFKQTHQISADKIARAKAMTAGLSSASIFKSNAAKPGDSKVSNFSLKK